MSRGSGASTVTIPGDRLASPGHDAAQLSVREVWALRRFWLGTLRSGLRIGRSGPLEPPKPAFKNIFPDLDAVFVHIPKTAGTSVHQLFSLVSTRGSSVDLARRAQLASLDRKGLTKHSKAAEYVARMGSQSWASAFTFTFVRNPWDMMVSCYVWWLQRAAAHPHLRRLAAEVAQCADFRGFLHSYLGQACINEFIGDPRDWFVADGNDLVSYVGRYEDVSDDIGHILDRLGVARACRPELPRFNQSRRRPYRDYYAPETQSLVANRFRYEIDRFGYTF